MANPHPKLVKGSKRTTPKKETRAIKRVIAYIRISKDRETQTSIETQEIAIRRLCEYNGWEVVTVMGDPGKSAYKKGVLRPQYNEAIRMIERGQVDAIVVFKLDRFSRSASEFWDAWQAIKNAGGHFISYSEQLDTSSKLAEGMLFLIATFAEMESEMKSDRAKPMHALQQQKGFVAGGPRPYGYDKVNSKDNDGKGARLTINESEAGLIRMAAAHVIDGGSIRGFINKFQPESSQAAKALTHRGLRRILLSPTIIGCRIHDGKLMKADKENGGWDEIISREQWDAIRAAIDGDERKRPGFRPDIAHLLTAGLIVCGKCEKRLGTRNWVHKTTKEKTMRYMCRDCGPSIDMDIADEIVTAKLFDTVTQDVWESWQTAGMGWDSSVLDEIETAMALVDKKYHDGAMSMQRWIDNMGKLEVRKEKATNQEPMDIPIVANLRESWDGFDLEDKRRVITQAFDKIELMPLSLSRDPKLRIQFNGEPN
jgi:DNA invertase Pin-like site-specific DNA recombinase